MKIFKVSTLKDILAVILAIPFIFAFLSYAFDGTEIQRECVKLFESKNKVWMREASERTDMIRKIDAFYLSSPLSQLAMSDSKKYATLNENIKLVTHCLRDYKKYDPKTKTCVDFENHETLYQYVKHVGEIDFPLF